ncbi:MAG: energy transducer TonB [Pseudomonadota bacterium]|jgi:protein TonB
MKAAARRLALVAWVVLGHAALAAALWHAPLSRPAPPRTVTVELVERSLPPSPPQPPRPQPPRPQPRPVAPPAAVPPVPEPTVLAAAATSPASAPAPPPAVPAPLAAAEPEPLVPPDLKAAYLNNPPPAYPTLSRRYGEQGKVLLRVHVDATGRAAQVDVKQSSGHERLDQAACAAVREWRFVPARRGETPVAAWVVVPISFVL